MKDDPTIQYTLATESPVVHAQQLAWKLTSIEMGNPEGETEADLFAEKVGRRTTEMVRGLAGLQMEVDEDDDYFGADV